jgi:hypothetical protein
MPGLDAEPVEYGDMDCPPNDLPILERQIEAAVHTFRKAELECDLFNLQ